MVVNEEDFFFSICKGLGFGIWSVGFEVLGLVREGREGLIWCVCCATYQCSGNEER